MMKDSPIRRDIHRLLDFRGQVNAVGYKPRTIDQRHLFASSLFEITSEHVSAISLLLLFSRLSSASALLRSCIESASRGVWILLVAAEEKIEDIAEQRGKEKGWLGLEQTIGAIEAHHKAGGVIRRVFTDTSFLNDLTHTGVTQIVTRMAPHMGQDATSDINRVCIRNAANALTLFACTLQIDNGDVAKVDEVTKLSAALFASLENQA